MYSIKLSVEFVSRRKFFVSLITKKKKKKKSKAYDFYFLLIKSLADFAYLRFYFKNEYVKDVYVLFYVFMEKV